MRNFSSVFMIADHMRDRLADAVPVVPCGAYLQQVARKPQLLSRARRLCDCLKEFGRRLLHLALTEQLIGFGLFRGIWGGRLRLARPAHQQAQQTRTTRMPTHSKFPTELVADCAWRLPFRSAHAGAGESIADFQDRRGSSFRRLAGACSMALWTLTWSLQNQWLSVSRFSGAKEPQIR